MVLPRRSEGPEAASSPIPKGLEGLESVAWLMDGAFRIPGTPFRVGLDAILGLLPIGGDALTGIVQVGLVATALYRYDVPKVVAARMAANVLLDLTIGAIPILGDLFDMVFKANTRNVALLTEVKALRAEGRPVPTRPSAIYLISLVVGLILFLFLILAAFVALVVWLLRKLPA